MVCTLKTPSHIVSLVFSENKEFILIDHNHVFIVSDDQESIEKIISSLKRASSFNIA